MKRILKTAVLAASAVGFAAVASVSAMAAGHGPERYVMITHTQGTDPFWPVVEKGGRDAAAAVGAELEYNFDVS
ncbi:MAG: LacI family transcriptional regulator, partial [Pseudomonadota bacterium]